MKIQITQAKAKYPLFVSEIHLERSQIADYEVCLKVEHAKDFPDSLCDKFEEFLKDVEDTKVVAF